MSITDKSSFSAPGMLPATSQGAAFPTVKKIQVNRLGQFFANMRRRIEYECLTRVTPMVSAAGGIFVKMASSISHALQVKPGRKDDKSVFSNLSGRVKLIGSFKIIGSAIAGIAAIYNMATQIIEVNDEVRKKRIWEGVDAALALGEGVGNLMESVASFAQGLSVVQTSLGAMSWAPPVAIAGALLSALAIPLNIRSVLRTKEILKKFEEPEALEYLKTELLNKEKGDGDFFLRRHFDVSNREKYGAQILHIINSDLNPAKVDPAIPAEKREVAKKEMIDALKGRLSGKITSHALVITAAIITLIGVMLLLFPVFGPIGMICGLALLGAASSLSLSKYVYDYRATSKLQKKLDELCDFSKIPDNELPDFAKPLRSHLIKA